MPSLRVPVPASYPPAPFPAHLHTHPLLIIDYHKIQSGDPDEINQLYNACTSLGFFYLKNHGVDSEPMFAMGEETFGLDIEELMKFEQGDSGMSAGFKNAGANGVDKEGNKDTIYFMNVAKDDALAFPTVRQRTYPSTVTSKMPTVIRPFISQSDTILKTLMNACEPLLGLPKGTFDKLHVNDQLSGSESRVIMKPAEGEGGFIPEGKMPDGTGAAAIGAHTDFGSFSMLHSRGTGGLQVLPPGTDEWQYIKPLEGHVVCNVGDTLSVFTGGLFRSNIHRVIPPPSPQNTFTRWSLVFFIRPYFDCALEPLSNLSNMIREAELNNPVLAKMEKGVTAGQWFKRRIANQRIANRKGPETWEQSRGTEHTPLKA